MPDSFQKMEEEAASQLFPYEDRPEFILGNPNRHRFCTFSFLKNQALTSAQVIYAIQTIAKLVLGLHPSALFGKPTVLSLEDGNCGWFEYGTNTREGKLQNIMFIFPIEGRMLLGTAGFLRQDREGEKEMRTMLESLKLPEKKSQFPVLSELWVGR